MSSKDSDPHVTRVSSKGQTTIPKEVREALGIEPGQEVEWYRTEDGVVLRKHSVSARGMLLADADESTRETVVEDLMEQNERDRDASEWNTGGEDE